MTRVHVCIWFFKSLTWRWSWAPSWRYTNNYVYSPVVYNHHNRQPPSYAQRCCQQLLFGPVVLSMPVHWRFPPVWAVFSTWPVGCWFAWAGLVWVVWREVVESAGLGWFCGFNGWKPAGFSRRRSAPKGPKHMQIFLDYEDRSTCNYQDNNRLLQIFLD
jgi:hypothetical protein